MSDKPVARTLPTYRITQTEKNAYKDISTLSGFRTHDPSIRVSEDSLCLRLHGHCDWLTSFMHTQKLYETIV
jgi:hypothetical protein